MSESWNRCVAAIFVFVLACIVLRVFHQRSLDVAGEPAAATRVADNDAAAPEPIESDWVTGNPPQPLYVQVSYVGTPTVTLEATLDDAGLVATEVAKWSKSGEVKVGLTAAGLKYRVRVAGCNDCGVTWKMVSDKESLKW